MAFSSCIWLTIRLSRRASEATPGSGFATPALAPGCHLPTARGRAPTRLWEVAKVTMCIFTSEWPQVGTTGEGFEASQTLQ